MLRVLCRETIKPAENSLFGLTLVRTNKLMRKRLPDVSKLIPLLDETQLYIPVVQRRHEVELRRINGPGRNLRSRHYVYDEIPAPREKFLPDIEVILIKDVPGHGVKGTIVKAPGDKAYSELLVPQHAVYASPENLVKYSALIENVKKNECFSTISAQKTVLNLNQMMVFVIMNMHNAWTLEKWHVRAAFRRGGIALSSEECLELPEKPISGPDPDKEGKHFFTTVIINGKERVPVLCRINHHTNVESLKIPVPPHFTPPFDPVFEEDRARIEEYIRYRDAILHFKF